MATSSVPVGWSIVQDSKLQGISRKLRECIYPRYILRFQGIVAEIVAAYG